MLLSPAMPADIRGQPAVPAHPASVVTGLPLVRDWFLIHLRDKKLSPIAQAFRTFLLEQGASIMKKALGT
jgi:hypothetical protein